MKMVKTLIDQHTPRSRAALREDLSINYYDIAVANDEARGFLKWVHGFYKGRGSTSAGGLCGAKSPRS